MYNTMQTDGGGGKGRGASSRGGSYVGGGQSGGGRRSSGGGRHNSGGGRSGSAAAARAVAKQAAAQQAAAQKAAAQQAAQRAAQEAARRQYEERMAALNSLYSTNMGHLDSVEDAMNHAYQNNLSRIDSAYNNSSNALHSAYNSSMGDLDRSYDNSRNDVGLDSQKSNREAYVNKMLAKRDMQQTLSAQGLNGGAAESSLASLENNYGNARNNIANTTNRNLAKLENSYLSEKGEATRQLQQVLSNLESSRNAALNAVENNRVGWAQQLANLRAQAASQYANGWQNAIDAHYSAPDISSQLNGMAYSPSQYTYQNAMDTSINKSSANNSYDPVSTQQAASASSGTNYAKLLQQQLLDAQKQGADGSSIKTVILNSINNGLSMDQAEEMFKNFGFTY